ncbi:MAG: hypothetical protein ABIH59_00850 [archaeon]
MKDKIEEQTRVLKEILKWIKITGMRDVKQILESTLDNDEKKVIYHYSDGSRGILNFQDVSNLGKTSIARYWKQWSQIGIVDMVNVKGGFRAVKNFNLEDFGICIPEIKLNDKTKSFQEKKDSEEEQENSETDNNQKENEEDLNNGQEL